MIHDVTWSDFKTVRSNFTSIYFTSNADCIWLEYHSLNFPVKKALADLLTVSFCRWYKKYLVFFQNIRNSLCHLISKNINLISASIRLTMVLLNRMLSLRPVLHKSSLITVTVSIYYEEKGKMIKRWSLIKLWGGGEIFQKIINLHPLE